MRILRLSLPLSFFSTNTPMYGGGSVGQPGEFSVNGQRTESNNYVVDGMSANIGINGSGNAGSPSTARPVSGATALGTTQLLLSVDALQEFLIQTSTYSAEHGRSPGAQISLVSRYGTNDWHGTAFDCLRNNVFDTNDWFNDYYGSPQPALRQNDFGGTPGGSLSIPYVYDSKDKTFFFFFYEGLRLLQSQASTITDVPLMRLSPTLTYGLRWDLDLEAF